MAAVKIVIIGGGSYSWGPLFIRDLAITPELAGSTIVLHDIDADALDLVTRVGRLAIETGGFDIRLEQTTDLAQALDGAAYVILTITTGGLETMRHDLDIPARYGIYQSVGDTVGPGGLSRGLRSIPVVARIARQMARRCPHAWLLNYSNPLSTLARAVSHETGINVIGLCHEWPGVRGRLAALLQQDETALEARIGGINHLVWLLDLWSGNENLMGRLEAVADEIIAGRIDFDPDDQTLFADHGRVKFRLLQLYGALPAAGDRHIAEFFHHFLHRESGCGQAHGVGLTTVADRAGWREGYQATLEGILSGDVDIRPFLQQPSGEAAQQIITALNGGRPYQGILNLPNRGQIGNLPREAIVETPGIVDGGGARGLVMGDLPPAVAAITARHVSNQELIVTAALTGDIRAARQALLNDPLVTLPLETAVAMLDELMAANTSYLPQFFPA